MINPGKAVVKAAGEINTSIPRLWNGRDVKKSAGGSEKYGKGIVVLNARPPPCFSEPAKLNGAKRSVRPR
jgi:hypothetical protein